MRDAGRMGKSAAVYQKNRKRCAKTSKEEHYHGFAHTRSGKAGFKNRNHGDILRCRTTRIFHGRAGPDEFMPNKFPTKLSVRFAALIIFSLFMVTIGQAETGGEGEFQFTENEAAGWHLRINHGHQNQPHGVEFKGKWRVSTLVGEPLKIVSVKWKVGDSVRFNGNHYSSTAAKCEDYIPQSVIDKIRIIDFEIGGTVIEISENQNPIRYTELEHNGDLPHSTVFLFINADAMAKSGGLTEWGKSNLTVPSSPDWGDLFYENMEHRTVHAFMRENLGFLSGYTSGDTAKSIVRAGFDLAKIKITKLQYNMESVRAWLAKNECEKKKKEKERQKPETNSGSQLTGANRNPVDSFEEQLAAVETYRAGINRQKAEAEKKRQALLKLQEQELAKARKAFQDTINKARQSISAVGGQYLGDFETNGSSINIEYWDHGQEDGDRVEIQVNGIPKIPNIHLKNKHNNNQIKLGVGINKISIKALNEGTSSPNTAAFVIKSDRGEYFIEKEWNLTENEQAVILVLRVK